MRQMLLGAVLAGAGVLLARALGLKLGERCVGMGAECSIVCPTTYGPSR